MKNVIGDIEIFATKSNNNATDSVARRKSSGNDAIVSTTTVSSTMDIESCSNGSPNSDFSIDKHHLPRKSVYQRFTSIETNSHALRGEQDVPNRNVQQNIYENANESFGEEENNNKTGVRNSNVSSYNADKLHFDAVYGIVGGDKANGSSHYESCATNFVDT